MAYEVLAQKWRPKKFSDVVGQQHVITTLQNQILNERIGHAYLFWGPRGTGKTSIARLLAKTVNCTNIWEAEPCNICKNCKEITQDRCIDVLEIDAASNRGIDPIRDLKEKVKLASTRCEYKIYIIDEVHMLTREAFNALLKTLEEPPRNVIFILATTEYQKIPKTITSRCQDFEFHYIASDKVISRLRLIIKRENIEADDEVLMLLAKQSDGCLRDAQNLLERLVSVSGKELTLEKAQTMLGLSSFALIKELAVSILNQDLEKSLVLADQFGKQGIDLIQCIQELIDYFRKVRLSIKGKQLIKLMELTSIELETFKEQAKLLPFTTLSKIIKVLIKTIRDIKSYGHAQLQLETALIEIHSIAERKEINLSEILSKLQYLEHNLEALNLVQQIPKEKSPKISSSYTEPTPQLQPPTLFEPKKQDITNKKGTNLLAPEKPEVSQKTKPTPIIPKIEEKEPKNQKTNKKQSVASFLKQNQKDSLHLEKDKEFLQKKTKAQKDKVLQNVLTMFNANIVEIK